MPRRSRQRGAWSPWLLQGFFDHVVWSIDLMRVLWVTARVGVAGPKISCCML